MPQVWPWKDQKKKKNVPWCTLYFCIYEAYFLKCYSSFFDQWILSKYEVLLKHFWSVKLLVIFWEKSQSFCTIRYLVCDPVVALITTVVIDVSSLCLQFMTEFLKDSYDYSSFSYMYSSYNSDKDLVWGKKKWLTK